MENKNRKILNNNFSSNIIQDFFSSLIVEKEEEYISAIKSSSLKLWTFLNEEGLTPLHQSISLNLYELSKEIIDSVKNNLSQNEFKSFINSKTNKGQTPLHYASFVGNIKLIKLLIQNGAEILSKTNNGLNVLHLATMGNKITSFYYFIEKYKININSKDIKENTNLHLATFFNSKKIFNYLLTNNKIDINSQNKDGYTPLHFAVINHNKSMVKKLLMKGADCNIKNNKLLTPEELEKENNYNSVKNIIKRNKFNYKILKYSNYTKFIFIFLSIIPFLYIFYFKFDIIKLIIYILWLIIFIYIIIRFYSINPTIYNNNKTYLLNLLETEEKSIEDYCLNCQIVQNHNTVHCLVCNKCIEGFDHHCFWINKCIGSKNKNYFNQLICAIEIHLIINFIISLNALHRRKSDNGGHLFYNDFFKLILIIINIIILLFSSIVICPLIKLYIINKKKILVKLLIIIILEIIDFLINFKKN